MLSLSSELSFLQRQSLLVISGAFWIFLLVSLFACGEQDTWTSLTKKANAAEKTGDSLLAMKLYTEALTQLERAPETDDAAKKEKLKTLNQLSALALDRKQLSAAQSYANSALSLAERIFGPDDINVMPHVIQQQRVFEASQNKPKASQCMMRVIDLQEKRTGPESVPVMWLLDQYARSKSLTCGDKFDPARLRQLVRLREKHASKDDLETIRDKMILATCLVNQGDGKDDQEAFQLYQYCLEVSRKKHPGFLPSLVLSYARDLGKRNKDPDKSISMLQEAYLPIGPGKRFNPNLSPDLASELASLLESRNRKKEAHEIYKGIVDELKLRKITAKLDYYENCLERTSN